MRPHTKLHLNAAALLLAAFLLAACGQPTSTAATSTAPAAFPTIADTPLAATLPPTWTPTFTPSPLPATAPPTLTLTPSITPTLPAESICEQFTLLYEIRQLQVFRQDKVIPFALDIPVPDVIVRFLATHRASGQNQGVELPGGQTYLFELDVSLLPTTGLYDWALWIDSPAYGEICQHEGTLIVLPPPPAEPTSEITPEN